MDRSFHGERRLTMEDMAELNVLHGRYKQEIGEEQPGPEELGRSPSGHREASGGICVSGKRRSIHDGGLCRV